MIIDSANYTCPGGHDINEDSFLCRSDRGIFIVADGLGGHSEGEKASGTAIAFFDQCCQGGYTDERISTLMEGANAQVLQYGEGGKTTVAAAFIENGNFIYSNVGDSRVYIFRGGKIIAQTKDHSVCQASVDMGMMRFEEIRGSEDRSRLLKVLGGEETLALKKHYAPIRLQEGDAFLICSDGFWDYVYETEMEADLLKSDSADVWLKYMLKRHILRAQNKGDNYTAICGIVHLEPGEEFEPAAVDFIPSTAEIQAEDGGKQKKKSPALFVVLCIVVVLLLAAGVVTAVILLNNDDGNDPDPGTTSTSEEDPDETDPGTTGSTEEDPANTDPGITSSSEEDPDNTDPADTTTSEGDPDNNDPDITSSSDEEPNDPNGNENGNDPDLVQEMEQAAYDLLPENFKVYQYLTRGMNVKDEPNLPLDGFYTCDNPVLPTFEAFSEYVHSIYTNDTAEKLLTNPFGNGPVYGDDNGELGISVNFKPSVEPGLSWDDVSFVCLPVSETLCSVTITLKDAEGNDVERTVNMLLEDGSWKLTAMIG